MFQKSDGDIIKHDQLVEPGAISDHIGQELKDLAAYLPTLESAVEKSAKNMSAFFKSINLDSLGDIKKLSEGIKEVNTLSEISAKITKAKIELSEKEQAQAQIDRKDKKDRIELLKSEIIEHDKEVVTLNKVEAANKRLRIERREVNTATKEGTLRVKEINAEIDKNNKYITENADKLKQRKINIGNYADSVKEAFAGTGIFGEQVQKLTGFVEKLDSPIGIATAAIAGLTAIAYQNLTSTQAMRDNVDALTDGFTAWAGSIFVVGVNAGDLATTLRDASLAMKDLEDEEIDNIITKQKLHTLAAQSREDAMQEGKTTKERIDLLQQFIDYTKQASEIEISEAKARALELMKRNAEIMATGKDLSRDQRKEATEAKALVFKLQEDLANSIRKTEHQHTTILEKDIAERLRLRQEADKEEVEMIDATNEDKIIRAKQQLDKEIKLNNIETKIKVENLKKQQNELGPIDVNGVDQTKEFQREINDLIKTGKTKNKELTQKYNDEVERLNMELFDKQAALAKKHSEDNAKISDKNFKADVAKAKEQESEELLSIEEKYVKQKDHSVKAEEAKQKAILAVKIKYLEWEKKLYEDDPAKQSDLQKQINDLKTAAGYNELENEKKLAEERKKRRKKFQDDATEGLKEGLAKRSDIQQAADQKDIDYHTRMIEIQTKLASEGKGNVLAEEIAATTKAEEKKLQDQKRQQKIQENITLVKTFSDTLQNALDKDEPFIKAFGEAAAATGIVKTIFASLISGSAFEGTEDTGGAGNIDGKGGKLWVLHPNERVVSKEQNEMLGGMSNDELVHNAMMFENLYKPQYDSANTTMTRTKNTVHDSVMTSTLQNEIRELRTAIENKPVQQIILGEKMGDYIEVIKKDGIETVRHHINQQKRKSLQLNG